MEKHTKIVSLILGVVLAFCIVSCNTEPEIKYISKTYAASVTFTATENTTDGGMDIFMSTTTEGAEIFYTTNGDDPSAGGTKYAGSAVNIKADGTVVKAVAKKTGIEQSPVSAITVSIKEKKVIEYVSNDKTTAAEKLLVYRQSIDGKSYDFYSEQNITIEAGKTLSEIAASHEGFSAKTMIQTGETISIFYERNTIKLTFLLNSGDAVAYKTLSGKYGAQVAVTEVKNPTSDNKSGHHFNWWTNGESDEQVNIATTFPPEDTTYVANWHEIVYYTLSYTSTYGTAPQSKQIACHTPLAEEDLPSLDDVSDGNGTRYFRCWKDANGAQVSIGTVLTANLALTAEWSDVNFIGTKSVPDAVGDIVFTDGSAMTLSEFNAKTTNEQETLKAAAVAVIFYVGTGEATRGTNENILGLKTLGVGLENTQGEETKTLAWAAVDTTGYDTKFDDLVCKKTESEPDEAEGPYYHWSVYYAGTVSIPEYTTHYYVTGEFDGANSWQTICSVDSSATENPAENYPAFNWVNTYGTSHSISGVYASGWYLPSCVELRIIYDNVSVVNDAIEAVGGTKIAQVYYMSSSQESSYYNVYVTPFQYNLIAFSGKTYETSVLAIRAF